MNCRYCGSTNASAERRCSRCGRRLHLAAARPAPDVFPVAGVSALLAQQQLAPFPSELPQSHREDEPTPEPSRRAPYQPALFVTRDMGRVVPIEAYKQRAAERSERARQAEAAAEHLVRRPAAGEQGHLQFDAAPVSAARRQSALDARHSDAPVAIPTHRMMAAFIDGLVVLAIAGILCLTIAFGIGAGNLPGGKPIVWFAGISVAIGLAYKFFWAIAGADSPGLRSAQLRLLHFDGREPSQRERCARILWSLLSIMAGGLGLIWALVDEESLSWHDHSSKTLLTPYATKRS